MGIIHRISERYYQECVVVGLIPQQDFNTLIYSFFHQICKLSSFNKLLKFGFHLPVSIWLITQFAREVNFQIKDCGNIVFSASEFPFGQSGLNGRYTTNDIDGLFNIQTEHSLLDWSRFETLLSKRGFEPNTDFFQSFDTLQSIQRRLLLMHFHNDLADRKILQLGDDELFCIAMAMTTLPKKIHVFDIDKTILELVDNIAISEKLNIETHKVDILKDSLPDLQSDVFFISSLKDKAGLLVNLAKAVLATKKGGKPGYIAFDIDVYSTNPTTLARRHDFLARLLNLDCLPTMIAPCDDIRFTYAELSYLIEVSREAIRNNLSLLDIATKLRSKAAEKSLEMLTHKAKFPWIKISPTSLMRIELGEQAHSKSAQYLRLFHGIQK